jgi:hypothetical protein
VGSTNVKGWHADHVYRHDPNTIECFLLTAFLACNLFHAFFALNLKRRSERTEPRFSGAASWRRRSMPESTPPSRRESIPNLTLRLPTASFPISLRCPGARVRPAVLRTAFQSFLTRPKHHCDSPQLPRHPNLIAPTQFSGRPRCWLRNRGHRHTDHTDPFTLQYVAGRDNIKTTMRYLRAREAAVHKLFARLANLEQPEERVACKRSVQNPVRFEMPSENELAKLLIADNLQSAEVVELADTPS